MRTPFRNLLCGMTVSGAFVLAQTPISVNVSEVPNGPAWKNVSIKVTNQSASPITAIAVRSLCALKSGGRPPNSVGRRDDPFVRIRPGIDAAIAPGGTMEYQIGGAPPPFGDWACTGTVEAALFLDGTAIGDATMVDRLRRSRVLTAREIAWHITALSRFQGSRKSERYRPGCLGRSSGLDRIDGSQFRRIRRRRKRVASWSVTICSTWSRWTVARRWMHRASTGSYSPWSNGSCAWRRRFRKPRRSDVVRYSGTVIGSSKAILPAGKRGAPC